LTVSTTTSRADYNGNGTTTAFAVPFYFLDQTHLTVLRTQISTGVITTLALTTNYTVTGAGNPAGGTVTCLVAPTADQKLSILRNVPFTQLNTYVPNDPFPAASHERALDQLTMEVQQLDEAIDRALSLPANTAAGSVSATLPTPEANKFIGWNSTANGLQNLDASTLATVTAYGSQYVDVFSGTGSQTQFTLSQNPGTLSNLSVSISGVVQRPTIDYTYPGGSVLNFVSAPAAGTNNIMAQYGAVVPTGAPSKDAQTFDTVAIVNSATIDAGVNHIRTAGYYANGDGGGALYKRVASGATGAGTPRITSNAAATIWELVPQNVINVLSLGAYNDGTNAATTAAAINSAIAFLPAPSPSWGGGTVFLPAGNYALSTTIALDKSYVTLQGAGAQATRLLFSNMSSVDWIKVGTTPAGSATRRQNIRDLMLNGSTGNAVTYNSGTTASGGLQPGEVGGSSVKVVNVYDAVIERVSIENTLCGIDIGEGTNNITVRDAVIIPNQSSSLFGINWHCPNDNTYRSDILFLSNVVISGQYTGTSTVGIQMRGFVQTLTGNAVRILAVVKGMVIANPGDTVYKPDFVNLVDFQIEGCKTRSLEITHGQEHKFVNFDINNLSGFSGQGSADDDCILIQGNATRQVIGVNFTNGRIGLCRQKGVNISQARDIKISDVTFASCSMASSGAHSAVVVGATARSVSINNVLGEEQGGVGFTAYGVEIASGAQKVIVDGVDATRCATGAILDGATYGEVVIDNVVGPTPNSALWKWPVNSINIGAADANNTIINVGNGATGNKFALIDFIGDTTYLDYGLRIGRLNNGANGTSTFEHRGTGGLIFNAFDAGVCQFATTNTVRLTITAAGDIVNVSSGGLGYGTGSGGTVAQATSRTTGVTLNKTNGSITLVSAAGTATWQSFTVTNSTVAVSDTVIVSQRSGADLYQIFVTNVAAGSFRISFATTGGTTTEQPVFNFAVIKAVTA
jgi:hypothetical protein